MSLWIFQGTLLDKIIKCNRLKVTSSSPHLHTSTQTQTHSYFPYVSQTNIFQHGSATLTLYLVELLESQLEAAFVVGDTLRDDVLDGVFENPLVAHVGLNQVLKARCMCGLFIELEGKREGGMMGSGGKAPAHIFC